MSTYKFVQTPNGNLTVFSTRQFLLIWVDGRSYMVANPDDPMALQAHKVEANLEEDTPDKILERINEIMKQKK